jgi:transposase-like protein
MHKLARRHNLSRNLIRLWVQKYEAGELTDEVVNAVRIAEYECKIAELERKVGQLTMEVDLLKKAEGFDTPANRSSTLRPIKQVDDRRYGIWRSPVSDAFSESRPVAGGV